MMKNVYVFHDSTLGHATLAGIGGKAHMKPHRAPEEQDSSGAGLLKSRTPQQQASSRAGQDSCSQTGALLTDRGPAHRQGRCSQTGALITQVTDEEHRVFFMSLGLAVQPLQPMSRCDELPCV